MLEIEENSKSEYELKSYRLVVNRSDDPKLWMDLSGRQMYSFASGLFTIRSGRMAIFHPRDTFPMPCETHQICDLSQKIQQNQISIAHLNVQSLQCHFPEVTDILLKCSIDFFDVSEV